MPALPTFNAAFYQGRASRDAMLARLEPDPLIRSALEDIVRLCHGKAIDPVADSDVAWLEPNGLPLAR
jgi:hypothetical protein